MRETGIHPEFVVVDGGEGGTGAALLELSDWVGMPLSEGLVLMRNALVGAGIKQHVRLAASGKVYSGMGLALNMAQGADWCNAALAFMMSVGCIQAQRCHLDTSTRCGGRRLELTASNLPSTWQSGARAARPFGQISDCVSYDAKQRKDRLGPFFERRRAMLCRSDCRGRYRRD